MNIKDYFNLVFLNLHRCKKNKIYFLITFLCAVLCLIVLIFNFNVDKIINDTIEKEVAYRTISVVPKEYNNFVNYEKDIEEAKKIEHVIDAFSGNSEIVVESNLKNSIVDGKIVLSRASEATLPTIISGRSFKDDELNVLICPIDFYPDSEGVYKENISDDLLDKVFTVEYTDYKINEFNQLTTNKTYTTNFKIIGLYDTLEVMQEKNNCFIPPLAMQSISDIQNAWNIDNKYGIDSFTIVIDNYENVDYVFEELKNQGFEYFNVKYVFDYKQIMILKISIIALILLVLFTIIIYNSLYIKKKINNEIKEIGILRALGYTKKEITTLYSLEIIITNLLILIISFFIFIFLFNNAIEYLPKLTKANLILGGIIIGKYTFLYVFLIIVIIPLIVTILNIKKILNKNILKIIRSGE